MKTKKLISIAISLSFILSLVSCNNKCKDDTATTTIENSYSTETTENEPTIDILDTKKIINIPEENVLCSLDSNKNIVCSDNNFKISNSLNEEMKNTIKSFNMNNVSFEILDVLTNNTFRYNTDATFNGACIVKVSVVLYLLKLANKNLINLDTTIAYPGDTAGGSGYLNGFYNGYHAKSGTKFTLYDYIYYTLFYSDNTAYELLWKYLVTSDYYDDYKNYMKEINAESLCVSSNAKWVRKATSSAGVNVMREANLFFNSSVSTFNADKKFVDGKNIVTMSESQTNNLTYGQILYWIMRCGKYDYIEDKTSNLSFSKTGFVSGSGPLSCRNLISLSYGDRGYYICILTKFNGEEERKKVMNNLILSLDSMMSEYDIYIKSLSKQKSLCKN